MRLKRYSTDAACIGGILVHMRDFVLSVCAEGPRSMATVVGRSGVSTTLDIEAATTWLSQRAVQVREVEEDEA